MILIYHTFLCFSYVWLGLLMQFSISRILCIWWQIVQPSTCIFASCLIAILCIIECDYVWLPRDTMLSKFGYSKILISFPVHLYPGCTKSLRRVVDILAGMRRVYDRHPTIYGHVKNTKKIFINIQRCTASWLSFMGTSYISNLILLCCSLFPILGIAHNFTRNDLVGITKHRKQISLLGKWPRSKYLDTISVY